MQPNQLKLSVLLLGLGLTGIQAQESISAGGGDATGGGGTAGYTIGQVVYTTNTGTTGSVAQGIQQDYEISGQSAFEGAEGIRLIYSAYPNPVNDCLVLKVENKDMKNLSYRLYDVNGRLLTTKKVAGIRTSIIMRNFVPTTYFLKITNGEKEVKTFKIVRN
jgi:hypothetical protein